MVYRMDGSVGTHTRLCLEELMEYKTVLRASGMVKPVALNMFIELARQVKWIRRSKQGQAATDRKTLVRAFHSLNPVVSYYHQLL